MNADTLLAVATDTGRRLVADAQWHGDECTWIVSVAGRTGEWPRPALQVAAGPILYQGSAGVGQFLLELWRVTGEREFLRTARGAASHATSASASLAPQNLGFFTGRVGIAYFLARAATLLGDDALRRSAQRVCAPVLAHVRADETLDCIGGVAGSIAPLLQLHALLEWPAARTAAEEAGRHLIARARVTADGWWWGTETAYHVRGLTGLAHGAAGGAAGLMELYAATGDAEYRVAAEQAFAYEAAVFDRDARNWPDFRHTQLLRAFASGPHELRRRIRAGEVVEDAAIQCMTAWCHGAAGIGLSRCRALAVAPTASRRLEAEQAVMATARSIEEPTTNASRCHGTLGNCETLLAGDAALGGGRGRPLADPPVLHAVERRDALGGRWASGAVGGTHDPSLMLGDAGAGYFLLRLLSPETPNILYVTAPRGLPAPSEDVAQIRERIIGTSVERYFQRTRDVLQRLGHRSAVAQIGDLVSVGDADTDTAGQVGPVQRAYDGIRQAIEREEVAERREWLLDAFGPERARFEAERAFTDFAAEFIARIRRPEADELDWAHTAWMVSRKATVVRCHWDWDEWLKHDVAQAGRDEAIPRAEEPVCYVVHREMQSVRLRRVGRLTAALLRVLEDAPVAPTRDQIASALRAEIDDETASALGGEDGVRDVITRHLLALHVAGAVDAVGGSGTPIAVGA